MLFYVLVLFASHVFGNISYRSRYFIWGSNNFDKAASSGATVDIQEVVKANRINMTGIGRGIIQACSTYSNTFFLLEDGSLYAYGAINYKNSASGESMTPFLVSTDVKNVKCSSEDGASSAAFFSSLLDPKKLFSVGFCLSPNKGLFGDGVDDQHFTVPTNISKGAIEGHDILEFYPTYYNTYVVTRHPGGDIQIFSTGGFGLGTGNPAQIANVWTRMKDEAFLAEISGGNDIRTIQQVKASGGGLTTMVLFKNGSFYDWVIGNNPVGCKRGTAYAPTWAPKRNDAIYNCPDDNGITTNEVIIDLQCNFRICVVTTNTKKILTFTQVETESYHRELGRSPQFYMTTQPVNLTIVPEDYQFRYVRLYRGAAFFCFKTSSGEDKFFAFGVSNGPKILGDNYVFGQMVNLTELSGLSSISSSMDSMMYPGHETAILSFPNFCTHQNKLVYANSTENCNFNGVCTGYDDCDCQPGWIDNQCSITSCNGILSNNSEACGGVKGSCIGFDYCQCDAGYYGSNCNITDCFGVSSNSSLVCSSEGVCISPDVCQCVVGRVGDICEVFYNPPSFDVIYPSFPLGRCSEISISTKNIDGYSLYFHWNSSHQQQLKLLEGSTEQHIDDSDIVGDIYFSVYAVDYWGRNSTLKNFTITRVNESVPQAKIEGPDVHHTFINSPEFYIQGSYHLLCALSNMELEYRWEQIKGPEVYLEKVANKKLEFVTGFPYVNVSAEYVFRFTIGSVHLGQNTSFADSKVIVGLRDLQASMNESSRSVETNKTIWISGAENSVDPEITCNYQKMMNSKNCSRSFKWSCLYSIDKVNWGDCSVNATFLVNDSWIKINPLVEGFFKIMMNFSKDSRSDSDTVVLESIQYEKDLYIPEIRIQPITKPVSKGEIVEIIGMIEPDGGKEEDVSFEWKCTSNNNITGMAYGSTTDLRLVLREDILASEFTTFVLYATAGNVTVYSSTIVRKNDPPKYGSVKIYPEARGVLESFSVDFQNWIDDDSPLEYCLHYVHTITGRKFLIQPYSYDPSFQFSIQTQGCRSNNYTVDLVASIRDRYHSETIVSDLSMKVLPVNYETLSDYFSWVTGLLGSELTSTTKSEDLSEYMKDILKSYNLFEDVNCSSMTNAELFCMSVEECMNQTVSSNGTLFSEFQRSSIMFIFKNIENMELSDLEVLFEIIGLIDLTDTSLLQYAFDLVLPLTKELENRMYSHSNRLGMKNWWDRILSFYERYLSSVGDTTSHSSDENYEIMERVIRNYIRVAIPGLKDPLNVYTINTLSNGIVRFQIEKDYVSGWVENQKLYLTEKTISVNTKEGNKQYSVKVPSSIRNQVNSWGDLISSSVIQIGNDKKMFVGFYDSSGNRFQDLESSSRRRRRSASTKKSSLSFSNSIIISFEGVSDSSFSCFEKHLGDSESSTQCASRTISGDTITCECSLGNSYFFVDKGQFEESEEKNGLSSGVIIGIAVSSGATLCLIILYCFLICIPLLIILLVIFIIVIIILCCGILGSSPVIFIAGNLKKLGNIRGMSKVDSVEVIPRYRSSSSRKSLNRSHSSRKNLLPHSPNSIKNLVSTTSLGSMSPMSLSPRAGKMIMDDDNDDDTEDTLSSCSGTSNDDTDSELTEEKEFGHNNDTMSDIDGYLSGEEDDKSPRLNRSDSFGIKEYRNRMNSENKLRVDCLKARKRMNSEAEYYRGRMDSESNDDYRKRMDSVNSVGEPRKRMDSDIIINNSCGTIVKFETKVEDLK